MKANEINIPVKSFALFINAAAPWISKKPEYKKGAEIRLAPAGSNLHVSVGVDSHYIEATLIAGLGENNLEAPIFLELSYLANLEFKGMEELILLKPQPSTEKKEQRAQFKSPGCNFRIPLKHGDLWGKNYQNLQPFESSPGLVFPKAFLENIYHYMELPNSFGTNAMEMVVMQMAQGKKLDIYSSDEWGAYLHTVESHELKVLADFEKMNFPKEFLKPYEAFKKEDYKEITLQQTPRHTIATIRVPELGFEKIGWLQPNYQKPIGNVRESLDKERSKVESCLTFDTKEFSQKVKQAMQFFKENDFKGIPLEFNILADQYSLQASLPHSEMNVQGKALTTIANPVRAQFQAQCLKDYLDCMDKSQSFSMEIFKSSVVIYQQGKDSNILYWLPVHDR